MPFDLHARDDGEGSATAALSEAAVAALAAALRRSVQGEVRFDRGSRALYATDASNYRQVPIGVVVPKTIDDVVAAVALCREYGAPVLPRGGGTSLAGQCCNVAVVLDFSKYLNAILALDPARRIAHVQPGTVLDSLRSAAETHHLTFGPDPATHDHNCLGGMLGNNSCGPHSIMGGRTVDNVQALEVLTYDGLRLTVGPTSEEELRARIAAGGREADIYRRLAGLRDRYADLIRQRYPRIPRRVSGYNLDELLPENGFDIGRALVGSEGTCVTILSAKLRLIPSPRRRCLLILGFDDIYTAGDHIPEVMATGPIACEGLDDLLIEFLKRKGKEGDKIAVLPEGGGWLLVEYGADDEDTLREAAEQAMQRLGRLPRAPAMKLLTAPEDQAKAWEVRESGLAATAWVPGMPASWPGWEDSAVPPEKMGPYLRDFRRKLDEYGYGCSLYGHFGQGCVHVRIDFDLETRSGIDKYRRFVTEMADLVISYGGSLSGEHGDGQCRAELLPKMYGPELMEAMREFKRIWDPDGRMNPGKVVDAAPLDANLRLGEVFRPEVPQTEFAYRLEGNFVGAAMRCVGVGKCRRKQGGVMCPSYMATGEEKHSTRGRARLLFEMIHGGVIDDGWRSQEVHDALDLCLACKGCKRDCPVDVDMATYKAEFHSRYYRNRWRPPSAYSMGLIHWWSRAAAWAPALANGLGHAPGVSTLTKRLAGIHHSRDLPRFARRTLQAEWALRPRRNVGGRQVAFFPDTFNNHFYTRTGMAALDALDAAGFEVLMPTDPVCCGRPLFAWGMLDLARRNLRRVMDIYGRYAERGIPIVGLEPGCVTSLVDELPALFPNDERARRIADAAWMLPKFLAENSDWRPPKMEGRVLYHPHCYQHAVLGMAAEQEMLRGMGLEMELSQAGCCGMAGSFGFEHDHYDVSMACAERVLLPKVRGIPAADHVVADGFACREQIRQGSPRAALHTVDLLGLAMSQARGS